MNVYAKFRCAPLHIKEALGIYRELISRTRRRTTTTTTTRVAFWDPPSGSKNMIGKLHNRRLLRINESSPPRTTFYFAIFLALFSYTTLKSGWKPPPLQYWHIANNCTVGLFYHTHYPSSNYMEATVCRAPSLIFTAPPGPSPCCCGKLGERGPSHLFFCNSITAYYKLAQKKELLDQDPGHWPKSNQLFSS